VAKRKLTAEDIFNIQVIGDIAQHPTEHAVAVVVTRLQREDNTYRSHIWKVHTDSGNAWLLTSSDKSETRPAWSPDGRWLAFLSDRSGDHQQLFVMPANGGEAVQVTQLKTDVQSFRWSPDGRSIAFVANVKERSKDAEAELSSKELSPREKYTADVKVITRTFYRLDGVGYFGDRRNHLHVVNVGSLVSGKSRMQSAYESKSVATAFPCVRLTEGSFDVESFDWMPDGTSIVFASNLESDADETMNRYLYVVSLGGPSPGTLQQAKDIRRLPGVPAYAEGPRVSPDGRMIAFYGHNQEHRGYTQSKVWLYDVETESAYCPTAALDQTFGDVTVSDTRAAHHVGLEWSEDQKYVYSLMSAKGTTQLVRVDVVTGECTFITNGDHCILSYSLNRKASSASLVRATTTDPGNVYAVELPMGTGDVTSLRQLTNWNADFLYQVEVVKPEKMQFTVDGLTLDGWVMLPGEPAPTGGYPTVVQVHGGPMAMYGEQFFFEFQLLAATGAAVIYCNPRGSMGYGQAFCHCIQAKWGTVDFSDIETFVDAAIERYPLNGNQIAIAGGSYGGFMAAWAIGHTDRYKAAVVMRSCVNEYSMFGTCDVGFEDLHDFGCAPWENPEAYMAVSPIASAGHMHAPVLIIHSENDLRCPIEQAEQLYMALRVRRVPVEFVRFPNEGHNLSRSGQPWHRVFRLEKIQSFLARELGLSAGAR
jgi:dipeptidyl aminopeptidase/acylaminoacyl peptidase